MKTLIALILLTTSLTCLKAQTWSGATPGDIFYNSGNVGIGILPAASRLHIADGFGGEQIRLTRGTGTVRFAQDNNQDNLFLFNRDASKTLMSWNANGNIGIGATYPTAKLQIADGNGGEQLRLTRGTGQVFFAQDNNQDNLFLFNRDASKTFMSWNMNGNVGIGVTYPTVKLQIADGNGGEQIRLTRGTGQVFFAQDNNEDNLFLFNRDASKTYMFWRQDGFVGIGTNNPGSKLTVAGDVHSGEVKVTINAGADFVFQDNYDLKTLNEVEQYKHLPDMEPAKDMEKNGIELGKMDMKLLRKIEELTLYMINIHKELSKMKEEN